MRYDIKPYVGVGELRFGMSPDAVHELIGTPRLSSRQPGKLRESYARGEALFFQGAPGGLQLVQFGFLQECSALAYRGARLFELAPLDAVRRLVDDDPDVREHVGLLLFLELGIALIGFHLGRDDDLAVTVFARGLWDRILPTMRPFGLSRGRRIDRHDLTPPTLH